MQFKYQALKGPLLREQTDEPLLPPPQAPPHSAPPKWIFLQLTPVEGRESLQKNKGYWSKKKIKLQKPHALHNMSIALCFRFTYHWNRHPPICKQMEGIEGIPLQEENKWMSVFAMLIAKEDNCVGAKVTTVDVAQKNVLYQRIV